MRTGSSDRLFAGWRPKTNEPAVVLSLELLLGRERPKIERMNEGTESSATQLMRAMRSNPADPIAVVLSSLLIIAGVLDLPEQYGLTTSQLAVILGAVGTAAGAVRGWAISRRR